MYMKTKSKSVSKSSRPYTRAKKREISKSKGMDTKSKSVNQNNQDLPPRSNMNTNMVFPHVGLYLTKLKKYPKESPKESANIVRILSALRSTSKGTRNSVLSLSNANAVELYNTAIRDSLRLPQDFLDSAYYNVGLHRAKREKNSRGVVRKGTRQTKPITIPNNYILLNGHRRRYPFSFGFRRKPRRFRPQPSRLVW